MLYLINYNNIVRYSLFRRWAFRRWAFRRWVFRANMDGIPTTYYILYN